MAGPESGLDDAGLVERAQAGDREALNLLCARHLADIYGAAYRVLGDQHLAEDAAQEACINVVRGLNSFRGDASFRTWAIRIAVNTARSAGRRQSRRRERPAERVDELRLEGPDPSERAIVSAEVERARAALEALPEKQRLAVSLRLFQGLSHREVAHATGSTEGSARVNYHLGIKRLRELMQ